MTAPGGVADIAWEPMPEGLFGSPALMAEVEGLTVFAFLEDGVPTWEVRAKAEENYGGGRQLVWRLVTSGTADSFEAAKAAAVFEASELS